MLHSLLELVTLLPIINLHAQDWVLNADGTAPCDATFSVDPANNNDIETYATFATDTRGQNSIIAGDGGNGAPKWRMVSKLGKPLFDWPLILNVNANQWQYDSNTGKSTLAISMRAMCELTSQCDQFYTFAIGNGKYISFATDFDGAINTGANKWGVQIYPSCGSGSLPTGDPSTFLSSITPSNPSTQWYDIRSVLAGGNYNNWDIVSSKHNGENFPVTFIFENDPNENTLSVTFKTNTFPNGISCEYNTNVDTTQGIKWYLTPDWPAGADEIQLVRGFYFNGNTDYPKKPLKVDPCSDDWTEEMAEEAKSELMKMIEINNENGEGFDVYMWFVVLFGLMGVMAIFWVRCNYYGSGLRDKLETVEECSSLLNNKV